MKIVASLTIVFLLGTSLMGQTNYSLKLNLVNNTLYRLKYTLDQSTQQTDNGQKKTTETFANIMISIKPIKQENDTLLIALKFDTIVYRTIYPTEKKEFDYSKPAKKSDYIGQMRNNFITNHLIAKISANGRFVEFTNYNIFKKNVTVVMDSVPPAKKAQVQKQADDLVKEARLKSMVEPFFAYLPDKAISVGDQWETSYVQILDKITIKLSNTFTLQSLDDKVGRISGKTKIESLLSKETQTNEKKINFDLKGSSISNLTLNMLTGLPIKSSSKSSIMGNANVKMNDKEIKIPIVIESTSKIIYSK